MPSIILLTISLALVGCSALEQPEGVLTATEVGAVSGTAGPLPKKFHLHDVPHNPSKQKGTDCAPDSLMMVLNYRGQNIDNDQVIPGLLGKIGARRGRTGGTSFSQMQKMMKQKIS